MHPALQEVGEERERGMVLNRAWRRYGTINSLALATLVAGWLPARLNEAAPRWLSPRERRLALAKDIAMGATVLTGLGLRAGGIGFAQQAPRGAVPMDAGDRTAASASPRATQLKRLVSALGGREPARRRVAGRGERHAGPGELPPTAGPAAAPPALLNAASARTRAPSPGGSRR